MTAPISTASEYCWLVEEAAYGVPLTTALTVGTNQFLVPLTEGDSFSGSEDPVFTEIKYGGGLDVVADVIADSRQTKISLKTLGYPGLTAFLLNCAVTRVSADQLSPYTTDQPPFDLVSFTAYHAIRGRSGIWKIWGYPGCKVAKIAGSVSRDDPKLKLAVDIFASKELPNAIDSSTLAFHPDPPSEANYPKGPYTFSHTAGNVLLGGAAKTKYSDLTFEISNMLDAQAFESHWVQEIAACGREATSDLSLLLYASSDLRSTYQALTSQGYSIEFNNGTHTQTINFLGNNHINKLPYSLPLGKMFAQKATFRNKWDAAANSGVGGDITVSNT